MRIVHHTDTENTTYHINKIGYGYYIDEHKTDLSVGPFVFYFIIAVITLLSAIIIFPLCRRGQEFSYYRAIVEMLIYSAEFTVFGLVNYLFPALLTNVLLHFLITSTVICQVIVHILLKIFG